MLLYHLINVRQSERGCMSTGLRGWDMMHATSKSDHTKLQIIINDKAVMHNNIILIIVGIFSQSGP